jgi:hypothetical protein
LANFICQGENFAVIAHDPSSSEQYFFVLCDKPLFTCKEKFQDGWGNDWEIGD